VTVQYLHRVICWRKVELMATIYEYKEGQKQPANESNTVKKKDAYSMLQGCCCRRKGWSRCRHGWMRTRRANHKSLRQCFSICGGGGLVLTHHLDTWLGNGQSTRHSQGVIMMKPGALLEIFFFSHACNMPKTIQYYFSDWWRRISPGSIPGDTLARWIHYAITWSYF
jgi:hypothetical protein